MSPTHLLHCQFFMIWQQTCLLENNFRKDLIAQSLFRIARGFLKQSIRCEIELLDTLASVCNTGIQHYLRILNTLKCALKTWIAKCPQTIVDAKGTNEERKLIAHAQCLFDQQQTNIHGDISIYDKDNSSEKKGISLQAKCIIIKIQRDISIESSEK
ncbi:hypothetical protein PHYBLDRAFT_63903 [Phycomyces blakesleeanus NRRL 1555(-)]|uniref:Uncharacterized protein n=1 Tax=Phycomyces blakesleeanus (strain ATCC 8743b / DSM 1359 / FGSC 10004 / NBRC 33097 / NRRL 1555) TaxID=763407 RepID=A0A162XDK4_PHYB8|nr:hypothetical protein PHYBLDRAFT_63903 [Phycomyces blakesleeanus NRRL 1555(-)]OAD74145.1 hypothetical protein PHYBLDRAFT_63903 [Phycomyces blakesleeanus NRRL 1555(-)]|eukprot:XP_018292185.1 hypothetical protein PHYBLDRAFT_63903 [Phycomyces blakesleeanus NRRL 1555(-)]